MPELAPPLLGPFQCSSTGCFWQIGRPPPAEDKGQLYGSINMMR